MEKVVITKLYEEPKKVIGKASGIVYDIKGEGYHPDHEGKYNPKYCEGFYITKFAYVHFDDVEEVK